MREALERVPRLSAKGKALVPGAGIEPARLAAADFESAASTNSTTRATLKKARVELWHSVNHEIPNH
jgi:hypothetical protein